MLMSAELDFDTVLATTINEAVNALVPHSLDGPQARIFVPEMARVAERYGEFITHIATHERILAFLDREYDLKEASIDDLDVAGLVSFAKFSDSEKDELRMIQRTAAMINVDAIRQ